MDDLPEISTRTQRAIPREPGGHSNGSTHFRRVTAPHRSHYHDSDAAPAFESPPEPVPPAVDIWMAIELFLRRWYWFFLAGPLLAVGGYFAGQTLFEPAYTATATLLRVDTENATEYYHPKQLSADTFGALMQSPELLQRIAKQAQPRLSPDQLKGLVRVEPESESDIVTISADGDSPQIAAALANLYAEQAVKYSQELQAKEAGAINNVLKQSVSQMDNDLARLNQQLRSIPRLELQKPPGAKSSLETKLQAAKDELDLLLLQKTDNHPDVIAKKKQIQLLEDQLRRAVEKPADPDGKTKPDTPDGDLLRSQLATIAGNQNLIVTRQREAQWYAEHPPGYCRLFAPAKASEAQDNGWEMKVMFLAAFGGILGFGLTLVMIVTVEFMDDRLKTAEDVRRITRLPLLAELGNIHKLSATAQTNWAFRTWTALQSGLSASPNHGLVCGFISSGPGEGRSTWINLLSQAASQCGFRVLTVGTVRLPENEEQESEDRAQPTEPGQTVALAASVLNYPAQVTQKLTGQESSPFVHIPLPGWVWSLDRRKQWQEALMQWRKIENVVILVELPPASETEAVLLAANLPNVIWMSRAGRARAGETRNQLRTLRDARCHLAGCVLNDQPARRIKHRFARWLSAWVLGLGLWSAAWSGTALAQPPPAPRPSGTETNRPAIAPPPPAEPNTAGAPAATPPRQPTLSVTNLALSFSALGPTQRGDWQKRLTLGPGDILSLSLYGNPDLDRKDVMIGPDGRLNYLQAMDVQAAGLTVDELRAKLDQELANYYRTPRTIIIPQSYHSKKYFVLGKVVSRGVYTLDRPITVVEALARAKGLETGLLENQNLTDLADLQRSFLVRNGQRLAVNFEKLFLEGDLSQNVALEPNDYLYFAAGAVKEVYVLGEVRNPGPLPYTEGATVLSAIAERGGFTDRAYKTRVMVVRGSLNKPQVFAVDAWATLEAKHTNFPLAPKDIVYVHNRPFIRVEELADLAASAFIQSVTAAWVGKNIGPIITEPFIPNL